MFTKIDCKDCIYYPNQCKNWKSRKCYACSDYKLKQGEE